MPKTHTPKTYRNRREALTDGWHPSMTDDLPADPDPMAPQARGLGVAPGRIDPGEAEVDRIWESGAGFRSFGHFVHAATRAQSERGGHTGAFPAGSDRERYERWLSAATLVRHYEALRAIATPDGMYEQADPAGGAAVPPMFAREVFDKARYRDTPLSRCRIVLTTTAEGCMPSIAETSRVDGSRWGGMLSYWENEAQQLPGTYPRLQDEKFRLKKLAILVPCTEELVTDSALLEPFLDEVVPKEIQYQLNECLLNGNGVGRPLGVCKAPGTITVAKDTSQAAGTVSASNIQNMWVRSYGATRAESVWYAQEDIDPDAIGLPVTQPTAWGAEQPCPHVKGRPFQPLENCQAVGTPGDVVLGAWSQYLLVMQKIRKAVSLDFKFDYAEGFFRFIARVDGQPLWRAPLTPPHSTISKSPFVILAQR